MKWVVPFLSLTLLTAGCGGSDGSGQNGGGAAPASPATAVSAMQPASVTLSQFDADLENVNGVRIKLIGTGTNSKTVVQTVTSPRLNISFDADGANAADVQTFINGSHKDKVQTYTTGEGTSRVLTVTIGDASMSCERRVQNGVRTGSGVCVQKITVGVPANLSVELVDSSFWSNPSTESAPAHELLPGQTFEIGVDKIAVVNTSPHHGGSHAHRHHAE